MHITKPDDALLLQGFEKRGNQCYLIATVGYVLDPDGQLLSEQSVWQWLAPQFSDEPFDVGLQKRRGTFGVAGNAYAPDGQPVARMALRVRFGGLEKMLHVHGDRQWQRGMTGWTPSAPTPFLQMPVDLAHALGGSEYLANPVGKGLAAPDADLSGVDLPNIEWPDDPIRSIHDRPPVATLGNLPATDPALAAWTGTFDETWETTRFPWLPDDVDARHFDRVAQDQCAEHYWRGNERWSVEGMHPTEPLVEGALPGLQPQLLWLSGGASPWTPNDAPSIQRAELMLDTVWLFPESGRQVLLYRACLPVQREDGADVDAIWIDTLPANAPAPDMATQLAAWSEQAPQLAPQLAAAAALGTAGAASIAAASAASATTTVDTSAATADASTTTAAAGPERASAQAHSPTAKQSVLSTNEPNSLSADDGDAQAAALPSDSGDQASQTASTAPTDWSDALWDEICREYADAWDQAREVVRQMEQEQAAYGIVFPEVAPFVAPPKPGISATPYSLPSDFAQSLQREVDEGLAQGQRAFEAVLRDNYPDDPQQVDAILARTRAIAQTPITKNQGEQILENLPPELRARADSEIQALSAQFDDLNQRLAQLFEKQSPEASVPASSTTSGQASVAPTESSVPTQTSGATSSIGAVPNVDSTDINGVSNAAETASAVGALPAAAIDNTEANTNTDANAATDTATTQAKSAEVNTGAEKTTTKNLSENADSDEAITNLSGVTLENQDYRGADLTNADLSGSLLTGCCFAGAVLNGASFKGAQLMSCDFTGAKMAGVQLQDMDARDTIFADADWREAQAQRMSLTACDLNGIDATGADLSATQLDQCTLDDARLVQATLVGTTLSGVQARSADFSNIHAEGLRIDSGTTLKKTSFRHASMPQCSFMQSHFPENNWQDADIGDGLVLACDLRNTQAQRLHARNTVFKDSRIQDADWRQADLMHASFDYAIVERVDMSGSNLHGAQTRTANIDSLQVQDALLSGNRLLQEHAHG